VLRAKVKDCRNSIYMVVAQLALSDVSGVLGVSDDVRSMCSELTRPSSQTCTTSTNRKRHYFAGYRH
jgi:hypothetical protein